MGNISLLQHEHEVERSRAKLTEDLGGSLLSKDLGGLHR